MQRPRLHKIPYCLLALAIIPHLGSAQDIWDQQSPKPTSRSLRGVFAFDTSRAFVCGENRHLLETKDGGRTWISHMASAYGTDPFYAVLFLDAAKGFVVGNNNDAWRTTNGGLNWTQMTTVPAGSWSFVDFVSPTLGFIGANGACAATSDAGANWQLRSGYPDCPVIYAMDFRDQNVGIVGGYHIPTNQPGIFKTTDGGRTWLRTYSSSANAVLWMSNTRVLASVGTDIVESLDEGLTWSVIGGGIFTGLDNFVRAGQGELLIGVSGKGDIWRSENGGRTWQFVFDGLGSVPDFWNIHFADANAGWVVGAGGFILATSDGGLTWRQVNSGCGAPIYDMQFLDEGFGMAVGHDTYVFRTLNGGAFWEVQRLEVTGQVFGRDEAFRAVDIVDRNFAAVAGPGGTVFKTTNGGRNWTSIGYPNLPGPLWIQDVDFIDASTGWVGGIDYDLGHLKNLYKTNDGGSTWTLVNLNNTGGWVAIDFVDSLYGWLASGSTYCMRTTNGGQTWTPFNLPDYSVGVNLSELKFLNRNVGWAVGWFGYAAKTVDGGLTWTLVNVGTTEDIFFDVVPVSASEIWICGRDTSYRGIVYHSTNGGASWSRQIVAASPYWPYRIASLPTGETWYGAYGGTIARRRMPIETAFPETFIINPGRWVGGDLTALFASDDQYISMLVGPALFATTDSIVLTIEGVSPTQTPAGLALAVESRAETTGIRQTIDFWNFTESRWETIHQGPASVTDAFVQAVANGVAARFVEPGTLKMRARIRWGAEAPVPFNLWRTWVDRAVWRVTR